ncbi:MAG TPA: transcription termination/antitermination NusG family protein [Candidatus Cybelea sp.]
MLRWYVAETKSQQERRAQKELINQAFSTLLLVVMDRVIIRGAVVDRPQLIWPGYLLVAFDCETDPWRAVSSTRGVKRLLGPIEAPTPLRPGFVEQYAFVIPFVNDLTKLQRGDPVTIDAHKLADRKAWFHRMDGKLRCKILLDNLSTGPVVSVPMVQVSRVVGSQARSVR